MTEKPLDVIGVIGAFGKRDFKKQPCLIDKYMENVPEVEKSRPVWISCPCPKCTPWG